MREKLEAAEIWFLRRMLKISWTRKTKKVIVLLEAVANRALVNVNRKEENDILRKCNEMTRSRTVVDGSSALRCWMILGYG